MNPIQRLESLGLKLPAAPAPVAAYVPARRAGDLVFISGQLPFVEGELTAIGRVPDVVGIEEATQAARIAALNALAVLAGQTEGGLDNVAGIIRLGVFVQSEPGFPGQPAIANGASTLMQEVFGDVGRHARAAVGSIALPLNASVEVEMIAQLRS